MRQPAALQLNGDDLVYVLDILRLIDARPFLASRAYMPVKYLANFFEYTEKFHSLSAIYEKYGIATQRVKSVFRASFPTTDRGADAGYPRKYAGTEGRECVKNPGQCPD